jgi:hypothetical protein
MTGSKGEHSRTNWGPCVQYEGFIASLSNILSRQSPATARVSAVRKHPHARDAVLGEILRVPVAGRGRNL